MNKLTKLEKFKKNYCEQNKVFGLIENQNWFITGMFTGFISAILGVFVQQSTTLGYIGFAIGAIVNYFMHKEYNQELEKFKQGRSTWNLKLDELEK